MPVAEIRGLSLHYEITGRGTPLTLLLPQSTGPAGRGKLFQGLARQHTAITYDWRSAGGDGPAQRAVSIAGLAAGVTDLLDALEIDRSHLVCHSTGCGIGLSVAARHPDRVAGLVLAAPWTHADAHLSAMQTLRMAAARALDAEQYARFNAAVLFPPAFRRADEAGFARMAAEAPAQPHDAGDIATYLNAILAFDARPLWPAIRCRTLVMVARDDQLMPPWFAAETTNGIRGAELVELDGGGHMLPETRTDEFVELVLAFLARTGV